MSGEQNKKKGGLSKEIALLTQDSEAADLIRDYAEKALDAFIEDDVIKDIPVIGTIYKLGNAYITIKDNIFIAKLAKFLDGYYKNMSQQDIDEFFEKHSYQEIGSKLIIIIDKQDSFDKAELIGDLFARYIKQKIDKDTFDRLVHSISSAYLPDLQNLWNYKSQPNLINEDLGSSLMAIGLAKFKIDIISLDGGNYSDPNSGETVSKNKFSLTALGTLLATILQERATA